MEENNNFIENTNNVEIKSYYTKEAINEKIENITDDIKKKAEIAKNQVSRLNISFTADEMKKLEIGFKYYYNINKKNEMIAAIKEIILKENDKYLQDLKNNL
jgi:intein/homing endonuclease